MKTSHGDEVEGIDFSALVLGSSAWPLTAPTTPFNIPEDLLKPHERFVNYYQSKHSGRKLNWLLQLCKGDLKTNYLKLKYTFQVSTYQMGILLPYNSATSITFDDLLKITGMTPEALQPQLALLCKAKVIIEQGEKIYDLNMDFKSKKIKINLNIAIKSEAKAEVDETHKTIEKDRELVIQVLKP
jgi:cullin 1